jgi:hypothetical protein
MSIHTYGEPKVIDVRQQHLLVIDRMVEQLIEMEREKRKEKKEEGRTTKNCQRKNTQTDHSLKEPNSIHKGTPTPSLFVVS